METDNEIMRVTVDRISNSGNAIAEEKYENSHIHVAGGKPGETCEIEIFDPPRGPTLGLKMSWSSAKRETNKEHYRDKYGNQTKSDETTGELKPEDLSLEEQSTSKNDLLNGHL